MSGMGGGCTRIMDRLINTYVNIPSLYLVSDRLLARREDGVVGALLLLLAPRGLRLPGGLRLLLGRRQRPRGHHGGGLQHGGDQGGGLLEVAAAVLALYKSKIKDVCFLGQLLMVLQHTGSAMASMWKHSLGTSSHPLQTNSLPDAFFLLFVTYLFSSTSTSSRLLCLQSHPPSLLVGGPGAEKGIYRVRLCRSKSNYSGSTHLLFTKYFTNISTGMTEVTRTLQTSKDNGQVVCSYYEILGSVRWHRTFSLETISCKVFPLYPRG